MTTPTGFGELIRISGPDSAWDRVRADLGEHGVVLLYALLADWRPDRAGGPRLRALLGRDWARYLELTHPEVRVRFAASRVLLKFAAAAVLEVPAHVIELTYGPTGRPYLRGYDAVDISLSHTDELLLVGMTTRGVIGVDAERADRRLYGPGLGKHLCTPHELELLEQFPESERNDALVRLWTLKEAYSKAIGQGMQFRFTDFGFGAGAPATVNLPDGQPGTGSEWMFRTYRVDEDYVVSVAVGDRGFGDTDDTAAVTMLESSFVDALTEVLGEDEAEFEAESAGEDAFGSW
ncbi:4'-phosphopantetheinyl transferase family protein [Actinocrinis sp.]|uniref:4'-phosphopantetheinyl transferase family protein n=1 Tax=Actinocrinis sp. TaxID=1920516 RepID=UPI002CA91B00|nr:4'-phosphopantetheinyl transferase superfamily protein [Actinocrinis sp.]HXR71191.1 4'-phosphopantetheinyl transferase superfamily protein [Actinocrinis sp.]